jgi:hypothetical protein
MKKQLKKLIQKLKKGLKIHQPYDPDKYYTIEKIPEYENFFRHLDRIFDLDKQYFLILEGAKTIRSYFPQSQNPDSEKVPPQRLSNWAPGNMFKSKKLNIHLNPQNINIILDFAAEHAAPEVCDHLFIHNGEEVIVSWYDFPFDPLDIDKEFISKEKFEKFRSTLQ